MYFFLLRVVMIYKLIYVIMYLNVSLKSLKDMIYIYIVWFNKKILKWWLSFVGCFKY